MKKMFTILAPLFIGCSRLHTIQYEPILRASEWCNKQPCFELNGLILNQLSSSILVFILAIQTLFAGYKFFVNNKNQTSRIWWGYTLLLTGIGAILAGISYQLFGYELKCADKEFCNWTNWFEIYYNLFTVSGAATLLIALSYSCFDKKWITLIKKIALLKVLIYFIFCLTGAIIPIKFLVSYEFLVLFVVPIYLVLAAFNCYQYIVSKENIYKYFLILWISLFTILGIYFIYLSMDITDILWTNNIWFSANDILHVLMIFWILYIQLFLDDLIIDKK